MSVVSPWAILISVPWLTVNAVWCVTVFTRDAARIYNDTEYGLSMAVVTEDYRAMRLFRDECEYGMGYVNLPCIGAEVHLPFGGVKKSGNGHPSAAGLIETVTHKTARTVNHAEEVKMAQGLTTDIAGGPA